MGLAKLKTKISVEDYLEGEKTSPVKHEYVHGEVYAMADTSDRHNFIAGDVYAALLVHLRGSPCQPFFGDIKVRVTPDVYYYPDVLVSCEDAPESAYFRNHPVLIVEVASPSTKEIDRREKLLFYQQMPSVREYAVVDQDKIKIELHRRQPDGRWITYFFDREDREIEFQSIELAIPLEEIYRRVNFENQPSERDSF